MEIKRQSIAFNILNNFKETKSILSVDTITKVININFNKGFINELEANEAFEQLDSLIEKGVVGNHKYFKREGSPGNYKYYYTEAEYNKAKKGERDSKFKDIHIFSLKEGGMGIDATLNGKKVGPVKLSKEDVVNFNDKTDRQELARKYLLSDKDFKKKDKESLNITSSSETSEKVEGLDINVGQKYHSPAPEGGEAIDFVIKKIDNGKYTIETINKEGRKGEHTFDKKTIKELISESKLKTNKEKEFAN